GGRQHRRRGPLHRRRSGGLVLGPRDGPLHGDGRGGGPCAGSGGVGIGEADRRPRASGPGARQPRTHRRGRALSEAETFDYVIVGAGSAGSVLANRLTADGRTTVCVIEAGKPDTSWLIRMPMGLMWLM